jgi:3-oxoacyl-[acyl-carrier-protein] synthase III
MGQAGEMMRNVSIVGIGSYLPEHVLTNADLEKMVDTTDEWIVTRTGIKERRIAAETESASDLGAKAALCALTDAGVSPEQVDMIIVATISKDMVFPNTGCFIQKMIGAKNASCFDIEAACSGFLFAVETARQFIAGGAIKTALVVGTEKLSCFTDWEDRGTCVLFGDGAGAVVLQSKETGRGVIDTIMKSDGNLTDLLCIPGGGSKNPTSLKTIEQKMHFMKMSGNQVFKHAVRCMYDTGVELLNRNGLTIKDIACVIPHQANIRILSAIAEKLGTTMEEKFFINLDKVGNISGASVPVALDEAMKCGRVKKGDLVMFVVFGGGFTWGAMIVEM